MDTTTTSSTPTTTTPRRTAVAQRRPVQALLACVVALAVLFSATGTADAAPKKPVESLEKQCEDAGGSWKRFGDGYRCEFWLFYGCSVDLYYDGNGNGIGITSSCYDIHVGSVNWK